MSVHGYEGPAGTGKTYSAIALLKNQLREKPLLKHQRVLALTFMHGSRRRLEALLGKELSPQNKYEAITFDSFAWQLVNRWKSMLQERNIDFPTTGQFDETCKIAHLLLQDEQVKRWICNSYPFVLADEAQDLDDSRLKLLKELSNDCNVFVAFDVFQCLDPKMRPIPIETWATEINSIDQLTTFRRTSQVGLLDAANSLRNGTEPTTARPSFEVKSGPHRGNAPPTLAAILLSDFIRTSRGSVAVLTPTRTSASFPHDVVTLVSSQKLKGYLGPFQINWEESDQEEFKRIEANFSDSENFTLDEVRALIFAGGITPSTASVVPWLRRYRSLTGLETIGKNKIIDRIRQAISTSKRYQRLTTGSRLAMTIHQAKNREFENVAVLWPYQVSKGDEQRRRLLYNAVTRAKQRCLIIVQDPRALKSPPFS